MIAIDVSQLPGASCRAPVPKLFSANSDKLLNNGDPLAQTCSRLSRIDAGRYVGSLSTLSSSRLSNRCDGSRRNLWLRARPLPFSNCAKQRHGKFDL
jgi:hypothetical protein